jgi:tetratricopeptide (TPR) repeat protein
MAESLRLILSKSNINVIHARSLEQARRLLNNPPDVFIVDYYIHSDSGLEQTVQLQREGLLSDCEVWVTGYNLSKKYQEEALKLISGTTFWAQPLPYLDIQEVLESRVPEEVLILSPASVRLVGQIWASRSSAILNGSGIRIIFAEGALIREDPPECLEEALEEDNLSYSTVQNLTGGDWVETGRRLLSLCFGKDIQSWEEEHRKSAFGFQLPIDLTELGLEADILTFLTSRTGLHRVQLSQKSLGQLYALWLLGVVKSEAAVERSRVTRSTTFQDRVQQHQDYTWILSEYERLKDADPFVVLGVSTKTESKQIMEVIQRMKDRYAKIQNEARVSDDIKIAAKNMLKLIKKAASNLHADQIDENLTEEQKLFGYAKRMIGQGNWAQAQKALAKAHQIRIEDVDILSHLGWVQYKADEGQLDEALENLHLALHLDSSHLDSLVFLARIYMGKDDYESAIVFLKKASTLTPDPDIQELRTIAEAELKIIERNRDEK